MNTWFFQRGDGMVFASSEDEAHNLIRNKSNWQRRDFTLLGASDGTTHKKALAEGKSAQEAFDLELEVAKTNPKVLPRNMDIITNEADRQRVLSAMNR